MVCVVAEGDIFSSPDYVVDNTIPGMLKILSK